MPEDAVVFDGSFEPVQKLFDVKGYRGVGALLKALERLIRGEPSGEARDVS